MDYSNVPTDITGRIGNIYGDPEPSTGTGKA